MRSLIAVFWVLFTLAGCAGPRHDAPAPGALRILLTNDDGYDSPGIVAMRDALAGAGHSVTVVAPQENRSGSSSSSTTAGTLDLVEQRPGVWSVSGTPADAVRARELPRPVALHEVPRAGAGRAPKVQRDQQVLLARVRQRHRRASR